MMGFRDRGKIGAGCLGRWFVVLGLVAASVGSAAAQAAPETSSSCTLAKGVYTCSWESFRKALAAAKTIRVETESMDRPTQAQMRKLVEKLGKTPAGPDEAADMTFLVMPMPDTGIDFGPAEHPVATLQIYSNEGSSNGEGSGKRQLVWAETVTDQADKPWGAIVYELLAQFSARVEKN